MARNVLQIVAKLVNEVSREAKQIQKDVAGIEANSEQASKGLNGLVTALRAAGIAAVAVKGIRLADELGQLGAAAERTESAFQNISGGAAVAENNLQAMIDATNGAISRTDAMAAANKLLQMGLADNATELGNLTEMAVKLGSAMGKDANSAIEEFALLLANQSIPRLDTFGISAGKVRTRIAELQAATEGMTRETAFMIAVQEEGAVAMERLGDVADDNALAIEQATAAWKDLKTEIGITLSETVAGGHTILGRFTRAWGDNLHILNRNRDEIGLLQANLGMLGDALGANNTIFDQYREQQRLNAASTERWNAQVEYYNQLSAEQNRGMETLTGTTYDSAAAWADYSLAIEQSESAMYAGVSAADSLADSLGGVASQGDLVRDAIRRLDDQIRQIPSRKEIEILIKKRVEVAGGMEGFINDISGGGFAAGGVSAGGWSLVGERGPEMRYLPPGSRVMSNEVTNNYNLTMHTRETRSSVLTGFALMRALG